MSILAVFRSRAHCMDFAEQLRLFGIEAEIIPTPKEANIGCGLCVRIHFQVLPRAQAVLKRRGYSSFKGFYKVGFIDGRMTVTPFQYKT